MNFPEFGMVKAQAEAGDPMFTQEYNGSLTERERHLIGITVAVTKGCQDCTAARLAKAKQSQIDEQAVLEAVNLAAGINSGFVITAAVKGSMCK